MVQESIVEYINSQMKLGVSRDAIKTTLTGAGWQAADVEDTLKKVEASRGSAQPVAMTAAPAKSAEPMTASKPVITASTPPQTIKVSDLVSSSASPAPVVMASKPAASSPSASAIPGSRSPLTGTPATAAPAMGIKPGNNMASSQTFSAAKPHGSRGPLITEIILIIIVIAVGAFAGFLYMQNGSLNSQLSKLNGESTGVNSQLSTLTAEVTASTTVLTAQVSTLTTQAQELQTELSFYAAPSGTTPGVSTTLSFSGTVSGGGKNSYVITAMYGGKIYVANSKSASVISALTPLMATTAPSTTATSTTATSTASSTTASSTPAAPATTSAVVAQFVGTYVPGSDTVTLTSVNGTSL